MKIFSLLLFLGAGVFGCVAPEVKDTELGIREDVVGTLAQYDRQFRECYQAAVLAEKVAPVGRMNVRFVIRENGQTAGVKILTSQIESPGTEACVVEVIRGLRFKALEAGYRSEIIYPLSFGEVRGSQEAPPP